MRIAGAFTALAALLLGTATHSAGGRPAATIASLVSRLSARQLAGQRVIYSYQGLTPPPSLLALIRAGDAAGVIFFGSNYSSRSQFTHAVVLLEAANAASSNPARAYPLLLMTDQEGGLVRRLPGAPVLSEKAFGDIQPLSSAEAAAAAAGHNAARNLRSFGLNVDLAPVLDVFRQAGDFDDQYQRSYSMRQRVVSTLGARFVTALQADGVAATGKHFPGLGAATASQNTDVEPVRIRLPATTIQRWDEAVYKAPIAAGLKLVMVSWAAYPNLGSGKPAGLSPAIVQGQLRQRLGFAGVTITDAIGAGALDHFGSVSKRAVLAAGAGMDLILSGAQSMAEGTQCLNGLASAYRNRSLSAPAFRAAVTQVLALRHSLPV